MHVRDNVGRDGLSCRRTNVFFHIPLGLVMIGKAPGRHCGEPSTARLLSARRRARWPGPKMRPLRPSSPRGGPTRWRVKKKCNQSVRKTVIMGGPDGLERGSEIGARDFTAALLRLKSCPLIHPSQKGGGPLLLATPMPYWCRTAQCRSLVIELTS
jgi:hypothetical protein